MGDKEKQIDRRFSPIRWLDTFIPNTFRNSPETFRARSIIFYCISVGGFGLLAMLTFVTIADGNFPLRRLGSLILISMLLSPLLFIRFVHRLEVLSIYTMTLTIIAIFYVDYNNQSIAGPATILWVLPPALAVLLFRKRGALIILGISLGLMILNSILYHQDQLPTAIVKTENWLTAKLAVQIISTILIICCTLGLSILVSRYSKMLESDLKDRQKRIQEIAKLKDQAEQAAKTKSTFLATMSHELRTPLNSVVGNTQLLERENLPDRLKHRISDISVAGNLLLMLINDILDFSKLEEGEIQLISEPYNLSAQILELCRIIQPKLKKGVSLNTSDLTQNIYINGDQNRLAQVLLNLLSNAAKFTDQGEVKVSLDHSESSLAIRIQDSGIGIRQEDLDKLFSQFSQVTNDSKRNIEGTGLGLMISKGLVELMKGKIEVASIYGHGSTFTVLLPDSIVTSHHHTDSIEASPPTATTLNLTDIRFLIVDDVIMNCTVLEAMLEGFGANHVDCSYSGEESIDKIKNGAQYDVILMDMRMPDMDGPETTRSLRKLGFTGKIIAVTANTSAEDIEECLNSGMDDFISKPIAMNSLSRTIGLHI